MEAREMKVLHVGPVDTHVGGPVFSMHSTLSGLRSLGVDAQVYAFPVSPEGHLVGDDVPIHWAPSPVWKKMLWGPRYRKELEALGAFDIYHAQGIWQWPTRSLCSVANSQGKPYFISLRAMLYPQDVAKRSAWAKHIALALWQRRDLNRACAVHVTCTDEMKFCRGFGITSPIAVIPNPVVSRGIPFRKSDGVFRVGYLGRLHRRKNVEGLIRAFAELKLDVKTTELLVIGGQSADYEAFLRAEAARLGVTNIRFTGFLDGKKKDDAISSLSVLAMPSAYENFGLVVLEGLVRGIPCIATTGSPWKELFDHNCGWWIEPTQEALTAAIGEAHSTSSESLRRMGENGIRLVEDRYSVRSVSERMKRLYEWGLGRTQRPGFVFECGTRLEK